MISQLLSKTTGLAVIGLGYVGLPVALAFAKKLRVTGYDINTHRLDMLRKKHDPNGETESTDFEGCDISYTNAISHISDVSFYVVCVPTPVDDHNVPDLSLLIAACKNLGTVLKTGDYVVFESTVYPGCTEEDCIPILEKESGLKAGIDFSYGYSPERINPGDKLHTLQTVTKVVAACNETALETISSVYGLVCEAGVYKAASIKVAEAAKVIENTQRDLNIALMNELSIIFDKMGIPTLDVLEAAGTKWNFLNFRPGLVGGHCIGVDPYYLTYKAAETGYSSKVITAGRYINDSIPQHVTDKVLKYLVATVRDVKESRVLIMGATFKENVTDIRNSKIASIIQLLNTYCIHTDIVDPLASRDEIKKEYNLHLSEAPGGKYDAVIVAVAHNGFRELTDAYFEAITHPHALIVDIKGLFKNKIKSRTYWSL